MMRTPLLALALAACSSQPSIENNTAKGNVAPEAVPPVGNGAYVAPANSTPPAGTTLGGDGSEIMLSALTADDVEQATLEGELGCSFSTKAEGEILVAMGFADSKDRAEGVVKVGDYVEPVSAPDGFDGMVKGPTFAGKGKTIAIKVTGKPRDDSESPPVPATLTYDRADGARRVFTGDWVCGP